MCVPGDLFFECRTVCGFPTPQASVEELLEALPCRVQLLQGNFSKVLQRLQGAWWAERG